MITNTSTCTGYPEFTTANFTNNDCENVATDIGMTEDSVKQKLCYYDRRNPYFAIEEANGYDPEEVSATGNYSKDGCCCDNCFYGRSKLAEEILRLMSKKV